MRINRVLLRTFGFGLACLFAGSAHAALVTYSFTTFNGGSTPSEGTRSGGTTTPANVPGTATNFDPESPTTGATYSALSSGGFSGTGAQGYVTTFVGATDGSSPAYTFDGKGFEVPTSSTTGSAPGTTNYLQFTVTPDSGNAVTYSALTFDFGADTSTTSGGSMARADLYYSINGSAFALVGSETSVAYVNTGHSITNISTDLSSLGAISTPVTFHLSVTDGSTANNKFEFVDNINLNGSIGAAPEPTSLGLIGLGAFCLGFRRRSVLVKA